jgi:hypothetical protein
MSHRLRLYATVCAALVVAVFLAVGATAAAPPAPTISGPANPTKATSASFTFSANTNPPASFRCRLDSASFANCESPVNYPGPLADGTHEFDVTATNSDGQSSASYSWTIDTKPPPTPTITATPGNPSNDRSPTFRFSDGESTATFECRLDGGSFAACQSPKTYTGQNEGNHTFRVRAVDALNNRSGARVFSWTIDLTPPPKPSISSGPGNPTTSTSARFVFSDSEGGASLQCRLDGGSFSGCSSPKTYSGVAVGTHSFDVRAKDAAGNTGATANYGWKVVQPQAPPPPPSPDKTAPQDVSRLGRNVGYKKLQIKWHRPPDKDFDHVRVLIATARKGAKSVPRKAVYTGKGSHYTNRHFKSGQYYRYRILSYDHAGNQSRGIDVVVPPSILLSAPRDGGTVHGRLRLVWAGVPKATFYNVQLYRNGRKILSRWPRASRLRLGRHWSYSGHSFRLTKGPYQWFVWPGFGPRAEGRYGRLLGQATFTVP